MDKADYCPECGFPHVGDKTSRGVYRIGEPCTRCGHTAGPALDAQKYISVRTVLRLLAKQIKMLPLEQMLRTVSLVEATAEAPIMERLIRGAMAFQRAVAAEPEKARGAPVG
jgi:hypothetical protein